MSRINKFRAIGMVLISIFIAVGLYFRIYRASDVTVAKNYCNEGELKMLNQIVSVYLDIAELQAMSGHAMHMRDWTEALDSFLKMARRDIMADGGSISHGG